MSIEAEEAPDPRRIARRAMRSRILCRRCGVVVTVLIGPAAAVFAVAVLRMGAVEAAALLFLISAWLGPLLMTRDGV